MVSGGSASIFSDILIDVGDADNFLKDGQLLPENFKAACDSVGQKCTLRMQPGYDHRLVKEVESYTSQDGSQMHGGITQVRPTRCMLALECLPPTNSLSSHGRDEQPTPPIGRTRPFLLHRPHSTLPTLTPYASPHALVPGSLLSRVRPLSWHRMTRSLYPSFLSIAAQFTCSLALGRVPPPACRFLLNRSSFHSFHVLLPCVPLSLSAN